MKIDNLELTGIKKVVVEKKVVWKKNKKNRWVKYIQDEAKGGKSEYEMWEYLNIMYYANISWEDSIKKGLKTQLKFHLWVSGDTINVKRNPTEPVTKKSETAKKKNHKHAEKKKAKK